MEKQYNNIHVPNLPVKPFHKLLKKYYPGEISFETYYLFKEFIEEIAEYIAKETAKEFNEKNNERRNKGLTKLKRLDIYSIKSVKNKFFNEHSITNSGEIEKPDDTLSCQDGADKC